MRRPHPKGFLTMSKNGSLKRLMGLSTWLKRQRERARATTDRVSFTSDPNGTVKWGTILRC